MENLLKQIQEGLDAKLYYLSLFATLAIPDICGAIDSVNGEASKTKYIKWYDKNMTPEYSKLNGEVCYYFRCSLLHQGSSQHPKSGYERIIFIEPNPSIKMHRCVIGAAYCIDVNEFCKDMVRLCSEWLQKVKDTPLFEKNFEKFMRRYPHGLKPYLIGRPVIG